MKSKHKGLKIFGYSLEGTVGLILLGVASWVFYDLINTGTSDLLSWMAERPGLGFLASHYAQDLVVILFVIIISILLIGYSGKKVFGAIVGKE